MKASRRDFLKTGLRVGAGGGLIALCAVLGSREGNPCPSTCQGCRLFSSCRLPQRNQQGPERSRGGPPPAGAEVADAREVSP